MSASKYFLLSDVDLNVRVKIGALIGYDDDRLRRVAALRSTDALIALGAAASAKSLALDADSEPDIELYVTAYVASNGVQVSLPSSTFISLPASASSSSSSSSSATSSPETIDEHDDETDDVALDSDSEDAALAARGAQRRVVRWNQWLSFPLKYCDLSPTSRLVFTVWDVSGGGSVDGLDGGGVGGVGASGGGAGAAAATHAYGASPPAVGGGGGVPVDAARVVGGASLPLFSRKGLLKLGRRAIHVTRGYV
jgi:hypothetical protein